MPDMTISPKLLNIIFRFLVKPFLFPANPEGIRLKLYKKVLKVTERFMFVPSRVRITKTTINNIKAEWVETDNSGRGVVLYFHGGAFCIGSPATHRDMLWRLAEAGKCRVFAVDYRKIPENKFPCWIEDAVAAYKWLLEQKYKPDEIVFAGDSAGGNIVLATLMELRDADVPMPAGAVCISPCADLSRSGNSVIANRNKDALLNASAVASIADYIVKTAGGDARNPKISPLFGNFRNLPPLLIHVSDQEILLDDAKGTANAAKRDGVKVTYREFHNLPHVFQVFASVYSEGRRAISEIGEFVKKVIYQ